MAAPRRVLDHRSRYPLPSLLALGWSAAYGLTGIYWWSGGSGFPYGRDGDPAARLSVLADVTQAAAAPVIVVLSFLASIVAFGMAHGWTGRRLRPMLTGFGSGTAFALALLVPDYRVFVFVAYTPIVLLGTPFGLDPAVLLEVFTAPMINQVVCIAGGMVWAIASLGYWQRTGIGPSRARDARRRSASIEIWGRRATYVAIAVPTVYALTRYAWALGIPLGLSEELFRQGQEAGLWLVGAALATLALVGAGLTLALVHPWGEVFPRWLPILGGREVPLALVVGPPSIVAVLVTNAGLMFWRLTFAGGMQLGDIHLTLDEDWAALAPELLWPLWGVALGAATFAYYLRRRRGRAPAAGA